MKFLYSFWLLIFFWNMEAIQKETKQPLVLLAILARNKAPLLPSYLACIQKLDYPKKSIGIYINTNNNVDDTYEILEQWVENHKNQYRFILFNHWNNDKITHNRKQKTNPKILGAIRNESLQKAREHHCDYYFVVDCDNFIVPSTLKNLINKQKPIIAPMLLPFTWSWNPNIYSNFFCNVDEKGYGYYDTSYIKIFKKKIRGTLKIPLIYCTYLIDCSYIDQLSYLDDSDDSDYVVFSRNARKNGVKQYICNEQHYGRILQFSEIGQFAFINKKKLLASQQLIPY